MVRGMMTMTPMRMNIWRTNYAEKDTAENLYGMPGKER